MPWPPETPTAPDEPENHRASPPAENVAAHPANFPARSTWKKKLFVLLGILLLGAAAFGWLATRETGRQSVRLSDGSEFELSHVRYGPGDHIYLQGTAWDKTLYRILPAGLKRPVDFCTILGRSPNLAERIRIRANRSVARIYAGTNALTFWTTRQAANTNLLPEFRVVPFDDHGVEFQEAPGTYQFLSRPSPNYLASWQLPVFPRRGKTIGLRLYQNDGSGHWQNATQFTIPNPAFAAYPIWPAETWPVVRRHGDLEFALAELNTALPTRDRYEAPSFGKPSWTEAVFRVTRAGQPTSAWKPESIQLLDATGNQWLPQTYFPSGHSPDNRLRFSGTLDPNETLKVVVKFSRESDFEPGELWTVKGVAVPAAGQRTTSTEQTQRDGVTISFLGLTAPNTPMPGGANVGSSTPLVHLTVTPALQAGNDLRVTLVRATDSRSQNVLRNPVSKPVLNKEFLNLPYPTDTTTLDLTFAIHKARSVEFQTRAATTATTAHAAR